LISNGEKNNSEWQEYKNYINSFVNIKQAKRNKLLEEQVKPGGYLRFLFTTMRVEIHSSKNFASERLYYVSSASCQHP
jgi:hypothetical protein